MLEEMSFLPGRRWSHMRRVATGKGALQGCQDVGRCSALGAWLLCQRTQAGYTPSPGHKVPLSLPTAQGWELAARPCSLQERLWGATLSPPWPLLLQEAELWQGQTCGPGCPLSSLLQGLTLHSQLGLWPPSGRLRRPGENNGASLPRPLSRGQQWQEPESEPPELISPQSLEGAGAGGGPWAVQQRLPPSPALRLASVASLPPSHLHTPQGTPGRRDTAAEFWGCRESPLAHGSGLPTVDWPPHPPPPAALCLGVPGHCLPRRDPARQPEVTSVSPAPSLCAGGSRWPGRKQLLPRGTRGVVPQNWCPPARSSLALKPCRVG